MKVTVENLINDVKYVINKYGNKEHVNAFDCDEIKALFKRYDNQNWPVTAIPNAISDIFSMLKLQKYYDKEEKS